MFMSCTDPEVKEDIIKAFTKESSLRIVIATVAFGMGIDCSGVHQIIHIDPPSDLESYIQEMGRVGRDGMQSVALLCKTNKEKHLDDNMIKCQSNETVCRRDLLFGLFDNYVENTVVTCACVVTSVLRIVNVVNVWKIL